MHRESALEMRSTTKTIARNTAFIAIGNLISRTLSFVFMVFVVRKLGGANFGKYSTVMAYVGIFAIFSDLGMASYAVREIAQDKSKTGFLTWNMILLRTILSAIVVPTITLIAIALGYPQETIIGIFIASCVLFLYAFQGPINNLMRGYERMDVTSMFTVIERVVFVLFGAIVLIKGMHFIWLIVGSEIAVLVVGLVGATILVKQIGWIPFEVDTSQWWRLFRAGLPFGVITLALMISQRVDTIILSLWTEDVVVGWYNVAYGLLINLLFLSDSLNGALGPTIARAYTGDKGTVNTVYQSTFRMLFMAGIPIAAGTTVLADKIIRFLYTDEFAAAIPVLRVMIWALPLMSLHSLLGSMAVASHKEKHQARNRIIAAVANVAMNLYAIPRYGLMGAAVATLLTELIVFVLMFVLVNNQFVLQSVTHIIGKPLVAALLMGGVVLLGHDLNIFLVVGIGALVYGLVLLATKAIDLRDPASPESMLLRKLGQRLRRVVNGSL